MLMEESGSNRHVNEKWRTFHAYSLTNGLSEMEYLNVGNSSEEMTPRFRHVTELEL